MKTNFVYIDSIDEIDTSKASVYDLNKRYMDKIGNMYGLRYNRSKRKVEAIRILRTSSDRAQMIRHRIIEKKKELLKEKGKLADLPELTDISMIGDDSENKEQNDYSLDINDDYSSNQETTTESESISDNEQLIDAQIDDPPLPEPEKLTTIESELESFNPDIFLSEMFKTINLHKGRFSGVIHNLQNSKMITHEDRELFNTFEDINRTLDIDGFQKMEDIISLYREITEYPRPISFYITHLDPRSREILNQIASDKMKYHYILLFEMDQHLKHVYKRLFNFLEAFQDIISTLEIDHSAKINALARQNLTDATFTLDSTKKEMKKVLTKLIVLEQYLKAEENFHA